MMPVACDLCGKEKASPLAKHGALSLCAGCADTFGGPRLASTGSLRAVAVAPRPSAVPTWRVPAPRLDELVRDLDGQFTPATGGESPKTPSAELEPARVLPGERPRVPRSRRMDASALSRGIMASAGISFAVILAFLSMKSALPRAAGVPAALAREEPAVSAVLPAPPPPESERPRAAPAALGHSVVVLSAAERPSTGPAGSVVAPRRPSPRPKPAVVSGDAGTHVVEARVVDDTPPRPDPSAAGPVPEFGGRD
jgi:hypothetical protein